MLIIESITLPVGSNHILRVKFSLETVRDREYLLYLVKLMIEDTFRVFSPLIYKHFDCPENIVCTLVIDASTGSIRSGMFIPKEICHHDSKTGTFPCTPEIGEQ